MKPSEFYSGIANKIRESAQRIAEEEADLAFKRMKERIAQDASNLAIDFDEALASIGGKEGLVVTVRVNFTGLNPMR